LGFLQRLSSRSTSSRTDRSPTSTRSAAIRRHRDALGPRRRNAPAVRGERYWKIIGGTAIQEVYRRIVRDS
jgi:hypothetical protein